MSQKKIVLAKVIDCYKSEKERLEEKYHHQVESGNILNAMNTSFQEACQNRLDGIKDYRACQMTVATKTIQKSPQVFEINLHFSSTVMRDRVMTLWKEKDVIVFESNDGDFSYAMTETCSDILVEYLNDLSPFQEEILWLNDVTSLKASIRKIQKLKGRSENKNEQVIASELPCWMKEKLIESQYPNVTTTKKIKVLN